MATHVKCSFCFKIQDQVQVIAGPNVFICQDRVVLCTEAFKDESDDPRIHGGDRGNRPTSLRGHLAPRHSALVLRLRLGTEVLIAGRH